MPLIKRLIFKCRETLTDKESQASFSVERCIYAPVHVSIKIIDLQLTDETRFFWQKSDSFDEVLGASLMRLCLQEFDKKLGNWKSHWKLFRLLVAFQQSGNQLKLRTKPRNLSSEINTMRKGIGNLWQVQTPERPHPESQKTSYQQDQVNSANSAIIFLINHWSVRIVRVPEGQGVGLQGPRGSKGRPTGSQGFKG